MVTENSNGYQVAYLRMLAGVVAAGQATPGPPAAAGASALISRGQPVFASSGPAADATDDDGESAWRPDSADDAWLALDLSAVPAAQRKHVVLAWFASPDDGYSVASAQGTCPAWSGRPYLSDYVIEVNAAGPGAVPGSGWRTVATVQDNRRLAGQHAIDLTKAPWVRIRGSGPNGVAINVEAVSTDAAGSAGWLFVGDSITSRYAGHQPVTEPSGAVLQSISALVSQRTGGRAWPVAENAGRSCAKAGDAVAWIDPMLDSFPGRYVALNFGTNDTWGGEGDPDTFKETMAAVVAKVVAHGKIPVVPTIPWPNTGGTWQAAVEAHNVGIRQLYREHPEVLAGPDLYVITKDRAELYDASGDVHPNEQGAAVMRRAWADTVATTRGGSQ
jgi:lysophospholipase L1-like esterase